MSAIQTIVNKTPKDKATNELYFRTHSIVLSLYFAPMRLRVRSRRLWLATTPPDVKRLRSAWHLFRF